MTLKKYLDTMMRIDPDGKIEEFVCSLTYLEARALKDCLNIIDEDFYMARTSIMGKIKKIHTKTAIHQYFEHDIEDVYIKVYIGNASEVNNEICIPYVGIKVSMLYEGLDHPVSLAIKSSDKDSRGFIDEKDWEEFLSIFMEAINRYIKVAKKGAPKFQYKRIGHKSYSSNRLNVSEDSINSLVNNPEIKEYVQNSSSRNTRYKRYDNSTEYEDSQSYTLKPNPEYDENLPEDGFSDYEDEYYDEEEYYDDAEEYIPEEESYYDDPENVTPEEIEEKEKDNINKQVTEAITEEEAKRAEQLAKLLDPPSVKVEEEKEAIKEPPKKFTIILDKSKKRRD